jgi:small subunit ribosomal protein S6
MLPFCSFIAMGAQLPGVRLVGQSRGEGETLRETTRLPRKYELMTIVSPDVAEDELPAVIDRIGGYIAAAGGTITETLRDSPWGRRRLAYAVRYAGRDVRDGFYTVYHFEAQPGAITDIERDLRITDQVMRFLVTHFIPQPVVELSPEATEAETDAQTAVTEASAVTEAPAEAGAPVVEVPAIDAEPDAPEVEAPEVEAPEVVAPAVEAEVEALVEAPAVEAEGDALVAEAPEAEQAEAPVVEEAEAPVKKRAPRRKKAADAEETETKDEPAAE